MSVIEKVKELWNSNCDDYYITDINNNVISSFYFGEAFKSENADKILKQSEETILKKNEVHSPSIVAQQFRRRESHY